MSNTKASEQGQRQSRMVVYQKLTLRNVATKHIAFYGMLDLTRRLYWLDTWMLREGGDEAARLRELVRQDMTTLRDDLFVAVKEWRTQGQASGMSDDAGKHLPVVYENSYEIRSPMGLELLNTVQALDDLLSYMEAMLLSENLTKQKYNQGVRDWRRMMWDGVIKPWVTRLDAFREEIVAKQGGQMSNGDADPSSGSDNSAGNVA